MKFAGHTMGAPHLNVFDTIELFKKIGYDGIEFRVSTDGKHLNSENITNEEIVRVREKADSAGLQIICLTSYYQDFVTEKKSSQLAGFKKVVDVAVQLGVPMVRAYGGIVPQEGMTFERTFRDSVDGVKEVARYAKAKNVSIAVETHIGSLTFSMRETVDFVKAVDESNVGILFDYAWVHFRDHEKSVTEAIHMSEGLIKHCHVKNWFLKSRNPIQKRSCLLEEGDIRWEDVFEALDKSGYKGYLCDEYEKFWYPDELPDPSVGMAKNLAFMKKYFSKKGAV